MFGFNPLVEIKSSGNTYSNVKLKLTANAALKYFVGNLDND